MARSAECRCDSSFTCRHCLDNSKPWLFMPTAMPYYFSQMNERATVNDQQKETK